MLAIGHLTFAICLGFLMSLVLPHTSLEFLKEKTVSKHRETPNVFHSSGAKDENKEKYFKRYFNFPA